MLVICALMLTGCKDISDRSSAIDSTIIPIIVYNVSSEDNITARPAYLDITKCTVEFSDTELFKVTGYFDYVCLNWDGEKNMRVNMRRVDDITSDSTYSISDIKNESDDNEVIYGRDYIAVLTRDEANRKSWIEFSLRLNNDSGVEKKSIKIAYEHLYETEEWITFANLHYDRHTNELLFLFAGSDCHVAKISNFDANSLEWSTIDLSDCSDILPYIFPQTSYFIEKKLYVEAPRDMIEINLEDMTARHVEGLSEKCQNYVFKNKQIPSEYEDIFLDQVLIRGVYKDMLCLLVEYPPEPTEYPAEYEKKTMYLIWRNDEIIGGIDVSEDGKWKICNKSGKLVNRLKTEVLYDTFGFDLISFPNC